MHIEPLIYAQENIIIIITMEMKIMKIDPFTVSITILVRGQSQLKLQQMYGKLFNFQTL